VAQDRPRRDPLERRAIWVFALAVLALILPSFELSLYGEPDWWDVALWIAGEVLVLFAVGAAGVALMPSSAVLPPAVDLRRAEVMSLAIVLLWVGLALVLANVSVIAVDSIGESEF
jgi:peptidoglycan/LPS O-acetylase OafA/YrhL